MPSDTVIFLESFAAGATVEKNQTPSRLICWFQNARVFNFHFKK